jgi:pimeloyl-ACP methyl ester carboxylesterase
MPALPAVEHRFAEVDGLQLHYAEAGEGETLVLVHGWPQHWWAWRELVGPLAERFRVICPDIRGLGWSAPAASYTLDRLAADIVGLLDALGIGRAALVGHDWGSAAGYRVALDWPGRVTRYLAVGGLHPWVTSGGPPRLYYRSWHIYALAALGDFATTRLGIPEWALRSWRHHGEFSEEERRVYLRPLKTPESAAATRSYYRNVALREAPRYIRDLKRTRLHVPTLHLNGACDPLTDGVPDSYRRFADDMQLDLIPDCGHFIAEERPGALLDRALSFLQG